MKKVATFGVFDVLHSGHIKLLNKCKSLFKNSKLIVIIARDSTVLRERKRKPVFSEEERRFIVQSLKPVDEAILGNEGIDKLKIVEKIKPDVIVLGYDQTWDEKDLKEELKRRGLDVEVIRLKKYSNSKSSEIKKKINI